MWQKRGMVGKWTNLYISQKEPSRYKIFRICSYNIIILILQLSVCPSQSRMPQPYRVWHARLRPCVCACVYGHQKLFHPSKKVHFLRISELWRQSIETASNGTIQVLKYMLSAKVRSTCKAYTAGLGEVTENLEVKVVHGCCMGVSDSILSAFSL